MTLITAVPVHAEKLDSAKTFCDRGHKNFEKGNYDEAIPNFNKALEIDHRYFDAYVLRGSAFFKKNQYDLALTDFNKALEINPNSTYAYYFYGLCGHAFRFKNQYD